MARSKSVVQKRNNQAASFVSRSGLIELAQQYHLTPSRQQGQHFMIDRQVIDDMIRAAKIASEDTVLEIGPGFGTLTVALAEHARSVWSVELDTRFAPALDKLVTVYPSLHCVYGDIFRVWPEVSAQLTDRQYKLVSNLPYNITSLVLRRFLEEVPRPSSATLLIQREVAERVVAPPGQMSILSVAVQFYARPKIIRAVDPSSFWPAPEVHSAILQLDGIGTDPGGYQAGICQITPQQFFRVVKVAFAARRKQLHNTLAAGLQLEDGEAQTVLSEANIDPTVRAQDLTMDDWVSLVRRVYL